MLLLGIKNYFTHFPSFKERGFKMNQEHIDRYII